MYAAIILMLCVKLRLIPHNSAQRYNFYQYKAVLQKENCTFFSKMCEIFPTPYKYYYIFLFVITFGRRDVYT